MGILLLLSLSSSYGPVLVYKQLLDVQDSSFVINVSCYSPPLAPTPPAPSQHSGALRSSQSSSLRSWAWADVRLLAYHKPAAYSSLCTALDTAVAAKKKEQAIACGKLSLMEGDIYDFDLVKKALDSVVPQEEVHKNSVVRKGTGKKWKPEFKELLKTDLKVAGEEEESDKDARARLNGAGSSRPARNEPARRREPTADEAAKVSWIWSVSVPQEEGEAQGLHDLVRVQWSKALARRDRWTEEVRLLREEMKRVLRSVHSVQAQWQGRIGKRSGMDAALSAGLTAYAQRQVAVYGAISAAFRASWASKSRQEVVQRVLAEDMPVYDRLLNGEDESAQYTYQ
uniref:Uncharacterized protein n=1 Tax=Mycena chlorophos TaxID=658473 RepID=A0ABQ0LQR8_MYCCL|nr:predicted protein [Mycena chlorophos]